MKAKVWLAQVAPALGDVKKNLELHLRKVEEARREKVELIVFPELSLSGYLLKDLVPDASLRLDSPEVAALMRASKDVAIVAGLVEEADDHRFYNSALFLQGGDIKHLHRKVYLPTYGMFEEMRYFAWGDTIRAFDTIFGRMAILICEDLWHPSLAYLAAMDGATTILAIHNSPVRGITPEGRPANLSLVEDIGRLTAALFGTYVLSVNRVGCEDGVTFSGGSLAVGPEGRVEAQAKLLEEELLLCELDESVVRKARITFPLLRDERIEIALKELHRIKDERVLRDQF
jgi:NAD+ synthase (glutamine-hydrolysing)